MESMADPILKLDGLNKHFGGVHAVQDISFSLNRGELAGLIGPNGAGKTTVFNLITGVYSPDSGQILFQGGRDRVQKDLRRRCKRYCKDFSEPEAFPAFYGA